MLAQLSSGVKSSKFWAESLSIWFFVCVNRDGSGKTTYLCSLIRALAASICNKYQNLKKRFIFIQFLTLYSVNMTYNLKKSIIQWEYVCICICLCPWRGSLSAQCVVLHSHYLYS